MRKTLHINDDKQSVALLETPLSGGVGGGLIRYQLTNHLDSASLELDQTGAIITYEEYHPFGTTSYRSGRSETEVSLKRYKYVFKELDNETGLYYYGMRYYAAWIARFISVDPLQFKYPYYTPYQYAGYGFGNNQNMLGWQNLPTLINTPMNFNSDTKGGYGGIAIGQTFFATSGSLSELDNTVGSVFIRGGGSNFSINLNVYNDIKASPFMGGDTDLGISGEGGVAVNIINNNLKYTLGFNIDTVTPVRCENNDIEGDKRAGGTITQHGIFSTLGEHQDLYIQNEYFYGNVSGAVNMSLKVGANDHSLPVFGNMQDNIHQKEGYGLFPGWDKNFEEFYYEFSASPLMYEMQKTKGL